MQSKQTVELAAIILNSYREMFERYEEACEEYHRQGLRPHYCIHGTNLWVDWDCACGACENSEDSYWDYQTYLRRSLDEAKAAFEELNNRISKLIELQKMGAPINLMDFNKWIAEPLTRFGWVPVSERGPRDLSHLV